MANLKVFSGNIFYSGKQISVCVAATSQAKAAKAANVSIREIQQYWSITSNPEQVNASLSKPETLFTLENEISNFYKPFYK